VAAEGELPRCWPQDPGLIEMLYALKAWREEIYSSPVKGRRSHHGVPWQQRSRLPFASMTLGRDIMAAGSGVGGPPRSSTRVRSSSALLAVVPPLLGFVPERSIIIIGIDQPGGQVKVTLRYDLPNPADDQATADIARHALAVVDLNHLAAAIAVGYGPDGLVTPVATVFRNLAEDAGVDLQDFLRVEDGRYWSCIPAGDPCPAEGARFDISAVPVPAPLGSEAEIAASRDAIAANIAPVTGSAAQSMRRATRQAEQDLARAALTARSNGARDADRKARASEGLAAVAGMIAAYRAGDRYSSDYQLALLTVTLKDHRVRDDAWARMDPREYDADRLLWIDVVRHAQPGYIAAPASLLAFVAWQAGSGVLANIALDRALADDPAYVMADSLRTLVNAGAPPSMARLHMTPEEVAACYES
jgi:hypothetical protein